MTTETAWPEMIEMLPDIDLNIPGVRGKLLQGQDRQVVFFELQPVGVIPPHSHGAQWGIVVEGEVRLTIGGETRAYGPGDSYYIPVGVEHSATMNTPCRVIDVFADADRYRPRPA